MCPGVCCYYYYILTFQSTVELSLKVVFRPEDLTRLIVYFIVQFVYQLQDSDDEKEKGDPSASSKSKRKKKKKKKPEDENAVSQVTFFVVAEKKCFGGTFIFLEETTFLFTHTQNSHKATRH